MRHLGNNWWDRHYRMICWMLVFLLLFLLLHAVGLRITPILRQTARLKATNLVTEQIERQVQESLQKSKGSFAKVERDEEGNILSIGLDVVEANRLRSELAVERAAIFGCTGQPDQFAAVVCPRSAAAFLDCSLRQPALGF